VPPPPTSGLTPGLTPDPDPEGRYLTLPTGTRRTSAWFGVLGVALLVLCVPFALPVDRDVVDGDYDTLGDAANDTVLTWGDWAPDLSDLDSSCSAPRMQPGMASLYADCGSVLVDLVGTAGVDASGTDSDLAHSADRAVRAAWSEDQDPMDFVREDVSSLFHPDLASSVENVLVSDTFVYDYDDGSDDDWNDWSPEDGFGGFGGAGGGGNVQDVNYTPGGASDDAPDTASDAFSGYHRVARYSIYAQAAAFTGPNDVMYTLVVSGASPHQVSAALPDLLWRMR
jgi:hypothetical protein